MFQHTLANKEDTRRLLQEIRKASPNSGLLEDGLNKLFDRMWPDLEAALRSVPQQSIRLQRNLREMTQEVVELVRQIAKV
jgi:hypothetical protein